MNDIAPSELTLEQKSRLVSGQDSWTTHPIPEHGIPAVRVADGPHGLRAQLSGGDNFALTPSEPATCFPPAVAVGTSWDPAVAERIAAAMGSEARTFGVDVVLGPGVNIKRSPLCGRNFEYFSEDPLLSGVLGAAYVRGMQGVGVGSSLKHFAVNNQEGDRMRASAEVDERTLREIYLPAFERVVKESKPATVMCAYNKINGTFASENRWLLTDVLRGEWGFDGVVVSDWGAVHDPAAAVRAGLDLEMPGTNGRTPPIVAAAIESGELDEHHLDESVARILALAAWRAEKTEAVDFEAHHALAREVAAQCAVLLKNTGVLPLDPTARVAVIGEMARTPRYQGGGSSRVNSTRTDAFLDVVGELAQVDVVFEPGYTLEGNGDAVALRDAAVAAASEAEVAVVFAGLGETDESEGFDRTTIDLPTEQIELIKAVAAAAAQTVVVLANGGVVTVEQWHDDVDAILEGFLLGQAGAGAVADLLYGVVSPSGRLAETIPERLLDVPSTPNFPGEKGQVLYGERLLVGYRGFTTLDRPVRYPFGFGLSYTTFELTDFSVAVTGPDSAVASVTVTNSGSRDSAEVVQVYVDATAHSEVLRPKRELRAFTKVHLAAGESRSVELPLSKRAFAYWDVDLHDWNVTPGNYVVQLCLDAQTVHSEERIQLEGDNWIPELTLWSTLQEWLDHPVVGGTLLDEVDSEQLRLVTQPHILRAIGTLPMQKIANTLSGSVRAATFEQLMARTRPQG